MSEIYKAMDAALLVVDPCNDFISEGGKLYGAIRETADASYRCRTTPRTQKGAPGRDCVQT